MHRIAGQGATPAGMFTAGDPATGSPIPTTVTAEWANSVQEEILGVVEGAGITPDPNNDGQLVAAIALLSGGAPYDNLLDNPSFTVLNRGYSPFLPTTPHYFTDRWMADPGDGAVLPSRGGHLQSFNTNFAFDDRGGAVIQTTTATVADPVRLQQRTLSAGHGGGIAFAPYSGKQLTASFYGMLQQGASDASRDIVVRLRWHFGTGGSAAADIVQDSAPVTLIRQVAGTPVPRQSVTFTAPDLSGLYGGTATVAYLELQFRLPLGGAFGVGESFIFTAIKLQLGGQATPIVYRSEADEMTRCLRYWEQSRGEGKGFSSGSPSTSGIVRSYELVSDGAAQGLDSLLSPKVGTAGLAVPPNIVWFAPSNNAAGFIDIAGVPVAVTGTVGLGSRTTGYPTFAPGAGTQLVEAAWAADFEIY